ncbi:MAG: substrate-binding domain-containing protein [Coprobacillus sp.]
MFIFIIPYWIYLHRRNKINTIDFQVIFIITIFAYLFSLICFIVSQGSFTHVIWGLFEAWTFPFALIHIIGRLFSTPADILLIILILLTIQSTVFFFCVKPKVQPIKIVITFLCFAIIGCTNSYIYMNRPEVKYKGHGFDYMNGLSSTNLEDYYPYTSNNKLVTLQQPSTLIFENEEDMPILDGAEACYPVYSAIAKATYKDIDKIESEAITDDRYRYSNGKIVTFTNTSIGYTRLFSGECDMFFGAKPSASQLKEAQELGVELEYTPIGKEGFVFFVNKDNPVSSLTDDQIKSIYHGDITNWKEVGGNDEEITAFQRPERSGSQSMMTYFMKDISLKEPLTYELNNAMTGVIEEVAQYYNESGAIGYTFRYFLEGLHQEQDVKMLSINDIKATTENIKNQSYPISTYLYCVTLKSNKKESVKKLKDYLLSEQGQYIIEKTGYCSLK